MHFNTGVKNADTHMVLVLEYAGGGDLRDYLKRRTVDSRFGVITEEEACHMYSSIVSGVAYCHKKKIIHRDLKLENILLTVNMMDLMGDEEHEEEEAEEEGHAKDVKEVVEYNGGQGSASVFTTIETTIAAEATTPPLQQSTTRSRSSSTASNSSSASSFSPTPPPTTAPTSILSVSQQIANGIKIADFGLSAIYRPGNASKSKAGSLSYMAPEVLGHSEFLGPPCDVWSLGVILFALVCGRLPFDGGSYNEVKQKIIKGKYFLTSTEKDALSQEVKDLLHRILKRNPNERLTLSQIISHPWMEKYAKYTVRRASGMHFPINNNRKDYGSSTTIRQQYCGSSSSRTNGHKKEDSDEKGDQTDVMKEQETKEKEKEQETSSRTSSRNSRNSSQNSSRGSSRYTPSPPPLEGKSPPSKGRMMMIKQLNGKDQQLLQNGRQRSLKKSSSMNDVFRTSSFSAIGSGGGSGGGGGSGSGGIRGNGTPPRSTVPVKGWATPPNSRQSSPVKIGSTTTTTQQNYATRLQPSPQSSPIPLSVFERRSYPTSSPSPSASPSFTSATAVDNTTPVNTSGLFIHEGQAESFQRIETATHNDDGTT